MEEIIKQFAQQSPGIFGVLAAIYFLVSFMNKNEDRAVNRDKQWAETLKSLVDTCNTFQKDLTDKSHYVIQQNSTALNENSKALTITNDILNKTVPLFTSVKNGAVKGRRSV